RGGGSCPARSRSTALRYGAASGAKEVGGRAVREAWARSSGFSRAASSSASKVRIVCPVAGFIVAKRMVPPRRAGSIAAGEERRLRIGNRPKGFTRDRGYDPKLSCGKGTKRNGDRCVADVAGGLGVCGEGTDLVEGACVPLGDASLPDRCGEGTELRDGVCVSTVERVECGEGTRLEDGTCVSTIAQTYFVGRFDGRGRAIRNLEVANPGGIGGLFYILAQGAVVQNLRLVDVDVVGGNIVGGLAGQLRVAWVYGVNVSGAINCKDDVCGLVGRLFTGYVETCFAAGWVTGTLDVGGLIGRVLEPTTTIRE